MGRAHEAGALMGRANEVGGRANEAGGRGPRRGRGGEGLRLELCARRREARTVDVGLVDHGPASHQDHDRVDVAVGGHVCVLREVRPGAHARGAVRPAEQLDHGQEG
eukprot:scaffold6875_cov63-Phaeocystis_antarctica.AAC.2